MKKYFSTCVVLFSCLYVQAQQTSYPAFFTVAQDGNGNFTTIQDAIFAVRDLSQQQVTIFIKKGVYR